MKTLPFKAYAEQVKRTQKEWAEKFDTTQPTIGRWLKDDRYIVSFSRQQPVKVSYEAVCWKQSA